MMKTEQTTMLTNCSINRKVGGENKRITKAEFGWICEIIREGEVVRRFECATMEEARRCEQG